MTSTPLIRLGNLFPRRKVYAKCEFLAAGGSFKIRGALHLLNHLTATSTIRQLIVPSMGNTALGLAAVASQFGFAMIGVVPEAISRAKDDKLKSLGVELIKITGGGSELLRRAEEIAQERGAYFVHPHLDPNWTNGYGSMVEEILQAVPNCRSLIIPVGGGGLLMGLTEALSVHHHAHVMLLGCEPYNYPKYADFSHERSSTIADGLLLDIPHPVVQERIKDREILIGLVEEDEIRKAMQRLFVEQGLVVEPSSAITVAFTEAHADELEEPICVVLTGGNIAREDFERLIEKSE
jgi:threonine dehydratase